jgi:hypothetical protein
MTRDSGYAEAISTLKRAGVPGITHIEYTIDDNVRSEFTRRVVEAFENISYRDDKPRGVFAP